MLSIIEKYPQLHMILSVGGGGSADISIADLIHNDATRTMFLKQAGGLLISSHLQGVHLELLHGLTDPKVIGHLDQMFAEIPGMVYLPVSVADAEKVTAQCEKHPLLHPVIMGAHNGEIPQLPDSVAEKALIHVPTEGKISTLALPSKWIHLFQRHGTVSKDKGTKQGRVEFKNGLEATYVTKEQVNVLCKKVKQTWVKGLLFGEAEHSALPLAATARKMFMTS